MDLDLNEDGRLVEGARSLVRLLLEIGFGKQPGRRVAKKAYYFGLV